MSLRKVLLVKPSGRHGLSFAFDLIPTGLEYMAAAIEHSAREVTILDLEMERRPFQDVMREQLDDLDPDAVGISMSATDHCEGLVIARMAKSKGAMTILGGYHPTAMPDELLSCPEVDVVVRGEGELTLKELVVRGHARGVLGTSYKEGRDIVRNADRRPIEDLDLLPFPARHLRRHQYRARAMPGREHDVLTTSRGCFGQCTFCCEPYMSGGRQRYRSPRNVVDEILNMVSFHRGRPLSVEVTDPNFLGRPERVDQICDLLAPYELDVQFGIKARADAVAGHPALIKKMISAGFERFEMGIESPDMEDIRSVSKGMSANVHAQAVKNIKAWGGNAGGTFVIGLPGQTEEQILTFPDYAKKIGLTSAAFGIATPFPGTGFYREMERKGTIAETDWGIYDEMHSVFKHEHVPKERLEELASICMARYWTVDTFLEKERMRVIRYGSKRSLAEFIDEKVQELGFSLDMGTQLQGRALEGHVESMLAASADPSVERYTEDVQLHDLIEMTMFLRLLGHQDIQLTARRRDAGSTSWIMEAAPGGVERIRAIPGRSDLSTIDLEVDLEDLKIARGEDLDLIDKIRIVKKIMAPNRGLERRWNLTRLLTAIAFEGFGYLSSNMLSSASKTLNGAHLSREAGSKRIPSRRRSRRLSY